ncbi:hypothetical protein VOLCADRAFT_98710 [Volvox carteri f. nagariensis]|uniref:Uncharacterized protein n=1 Tax=Volvox carteri f. nagariensis TaxID=3068 RepID=D8UG28_VOLCA|nr:uncharacterized protein VOLCADRAFT_98710 [Volvox carteri f. nagariensis]EFJ41278.1 hypothetical protein VOLCADRAFT_98710 [Volvox carteri f. nagariensis]|eukprot:XP_002957612.1 hypothetical protein VOLCADRAFT_98710 [Volvox carteri f. nagariensis]
MDSVTAAPGAADTPTLLRLPTHVLREDVLMRLDCRSLARCCAVSRGLRAAAAWGPLWAAQLHREFGFRNTNRDPDSDQHGSCSWSRNPPAEGVGGDESPHLAGVAVSCSAVGEEQEEETAGFRGGGAAGPGNCTGDAAAGAVAPVGGDTTVAAGAAAEGVGPNAAQATFGRLVCCPLAHQLLYIRRFHLLVDSVATWRVRISLKGRGRGRSGFVAGGRERESDAGLPHTTLVHHYKGGDTLAAAAGEGRGGSGEVVVLRCSERRCRGWALNPQSVWLRFRLPGWVRRLAEAGARQPPWEPGDTCGGSGGPQDSAPYMELTVLAEGLQGGRIRQWPVMHSSPFRLPQGDRMRLLQSHVEGPAHLAAYLHYEQLLPVVPLELEPEGRLSLPLPLHAPHPAHPGRRHYEARVGELHKKRRHRQKERRQQSPPPPPPQQQQQQQQVPVSLQPTLSSASPGSATASDTAAAAAAAAVATPGPSPAFPPPDGPAIYLYMDWNVLPTATAASASGGWVAGCVVRLWPVSTTGFPLLEPSGSSPTRRDRSGGEAPPCWSVACVVGDSRRGDVVMLEQPPPPPPPPPPTAAAVGGAPGSGPSRASGTATLTSSSTSERTNGAENITEEARGLPQEGRGVRTAATATAAAEQLAAAWWRAFEPDPRFRKQQTGRQNPVAVVDPLYDFVTGAGIRRRTFRSGACRCPTAVTGPSSPATTATTATTTTSGSEPPELCGGSIPLMVDLAVLDSRCGRVRLGRCGVEMWNVAGEAPGGGGSVSLHFLVDQLPPRRQSLWDNKVHVQWGEGRAEAGGAVQGDCPVQGPVVVSRQLARTSPTPEFLTSPQRTTSPTGSQPRQT